jgi:hypothetical protein
VSWGDALEGADITTTDYTAEPGVSVVAGSHDDDVAYVWMRGEDAGTFRMSNTITTSDGKAGTRAFLLLVEA